MRSLVAASFVVLALWSAGTAVAEELEHVGGKACGACHAAEAAAWRGSDHSWAWRPPTPDNVLGDFTDRTFEQDGIRARFHRRDGAYRIETQGPDGRLSDFAVSYVVGVRPLQQYLIELPGGRLQAFSIAWDTRAAVDGGQRWYSLRPEDVPAQDDAMRWTGVYHNWNGRCGECHATGYAKNYDAETRTYATTWLELAVSCEACHGPGSAHVAWAEAGADPSMGKGLAVGFDPARPRVEVETCARCHALRDWVASADRLGDALLDRFAPALLTEDQYFADGQQQGEVYTHDSFLQSRMYAAGVRCSDCHEPHSGRLRLAGNALCGQCHDQAGNSRFPTLRKSDYDDPGHHRHEAGTPGAACTDCHMAERIYMGVDARADHSFRIPRPDLSMPLGTPNACVACHVDRDDAWAAAAVEAWFPDGRWKEPHWGETIALARTGAPEAVPRLTGLATDHDIPNIVRATAQVMLRDLPLEDSRAVTLGLMDADPLVRRAAVTASEALPPDARLVSVAGALADPVRAVRTEAARVLLGVPITPGHEGTRLAFDLARQELRAAQAFAADFPEGQLNLAASAYAEGDSAGSIGAIEEALRLDPYLSPAWITYGRVLYAQGRPDAAIDVLAKGRARLPQDGEIARVLGIILAEVGKPDEAAAQLTDAARLLPRDARVRYNLGVLLDQMGQSEDAERVLLEGLGIIADDADILYALAYHYARDGDHASAMAYARRLVTVDPDNAEARVLLDALTATVP